MSSVIYRARKEGSKDTVIVKALKAQAPKASDIARFKQEYKQIKSLNQEGIVNTLDVVDYDGSYALILEDFDGTSLETLMAEEAKISIHSFLDTTTKIAEALGNLHKEDVIHRNIKPVNILINNVTGGVKITGFGLATDFTHVNDAVYEPKIIRGTLPYMSPEQTGRMNRAVDYRTDIYSLGITCYEMLTGKAPFISDDPLAIIHFHIAKTPEAPSQLHPDVPQVISDIVMKSMAKNCEDRYQNSFGLLADLKQCQRQLTNNGKIAPFELGKFDFPNKFIVPKFLFGREKQIESLVSVFDKLCAPTSAEASLPGVEITLVSGSPGIGKSSLIGEIQKTIAARKGYFISGKYEQYAGDKPYSAITHAFQGLVKQILSERKESIRFWKEKLLYALGANGKIITNIIPEIELIIGEQPEPANIDPEEARNRVKFVVEKFVSVFPSIHHPIALCLDDLQWADAASLQLLKNITTSPDVNYLYLIGSYRDNETNRHHPLTSTILDIEKSGITINKIHLGPLLEADIQELIKHWLHSSHKKCTPLAELVHRKTGGNPFFVIQFLENLYREKQINLDPEQGWLWDIERIVQLQVTDNVVELLTGKIQKLPENTREILKISAAIGGKFDLETLALVVGKSVEDILHDLTGAINEGLVSYSANKERYLFDHDRIQEASYALVPSSKKAELHYRIGNASRIKASIEDDLEKKLFYIVDQLILGSALITRTSEHEDLAKLCLRAGIKAKAASAYATALHYFETGISQLSNDCWNTQYELTLSLYTETIETEYLHGDFQKMDQLVEVALEHARSTLDKVKITSSRIYARNSQEDFKGAIDAALSILKLLGINLSNKPNKLQVAIEFLRTKFIFRGMKTEDLLNLPVATDPKFIAISRIMVSMGVSAFFVNPNLLALSVMKSLQLVVKHGLTADHAFGFSAYGIFHTAGLQDYDKGIEFGKLGFQIIDKLGATKQLVKTTFVYNTLLRHWKSPLQDTLAPLLDGYSNGLESGDLDYALFCLFIHDLHGIFTSKELSELKCDLEKHNLIIRDLNQQYIHILHSMMTDGITNLIEPRENPIELSGKFIDAEKSEQLWIDEENNAALAVFYFSKIVLSGAFSRYSTGLENIRQYRKYQDSLQGSVTTRYVVIYETICKAMLYPEVSFLKKIAYRIRIKFNQIQLKRWTKYAPANTKHYYHATEAMIAWRIKNDTELTIHHINIALEHCVRPVDFLVEGIIHEHAAIFHRTRGYMKTGEIHLKAAYAALSGWGAHALLAKLRKDYPDVDFEQETTP